MTSGIQIIDWRSELIAVQKNYANQASLIKLRSSDGFGDVVGGISPRSISMRRVHVRTRSSAI